MFRWYQKVLRLLLSVFMVAALTQCVGDEEEIEEVVEEAPAVGDVPSLDDLDDLEEEEIMEEVPDFPVEEETPVFTGASPVYFALDEHVVTADAEAELSALASYLSQNPFVTVEIEGHCDERGTTEYNLALGEKRAQSVKDYLIGLGVDGSRLSTLSYGEEQPSVKGSDETAWSQNRRAEFVIELN